MLPVTSLPGIMAIVIDLQGLPSAAQLAELNRLSHILASAESRAEVLGCLVQQVSYLMDVDSFGVALLDREDGRVDYELLRVGGENRRPRRAALPMGVVEVLLRTPEILLVGDPAGWRQLGGGAMGPEVEALVSLVAVPVWSGERLLAVTWAQSRRPDAYTPQHAQLLYMLSAAAGSTLGCLRLQTLEDRTAQDLALLCQGARLFASTLDLTEVLRQLAVHLAEVLDLDATIIRLFDRETGRLELRANFVRDPELRERLERVFPLHQPRPGEGHAGQVFATGEPLVFKDLQEASLMLPAYRDAYRGRGSQVIVPLRVKQESQGTIALYRADRTRPLSERDLPLLVGLADLVSLAIHNAGLYQAMATANRNLEAIIEGMTEGVLVYDTNWRVLVANRVVYQVHGLDPLQVRLEGMAAVDLARLVMGCHARPGQALELIEEAQRDPDRTRESVIELVSPGCRFVQRLSAPIYDELGARLGQVVIFHDITRETEAQRAKDEFVSVLSHELRTPLTSIKGYAQLLQRCPGDRPVSEQRALDVIVTQGNRMLKMVEDLLTIARLEHEGTLDLYKGPVNLSRLAADAIDGLASENPKHTFRLEASEPVPLVQGDANRLLGVLVNLIGNAAKYSPEGGVVRVAVHSGAGEVAVLVSDQGIGIAADQYERVFAPFYQVDSSSTRRFGGAGLGLYVSKGVVEAHGGRIWISSEPGQGSTFGFSLPIAPATR